MRFILFSLSLTAIILVDSKPVLNIVGAYCGKCTGSAYCDVCSNCSRCAHCTSGGSCGMCNDGYAPVSPGRTQRSHLIPKTQTNKADVYQYSDTNYENTDELSFTAMVKVENLNIRQGPGTQYNVIGQLKQGDTVEVIKKATAKWALIRAEQWDGTEMVQIEGYVYLSYLSL